MNSHAWRLMWFTPTSDLECVSKRLTGSGLGQALASTEGATVTPLKSPLGDHQGRLGASTGAFTWCQNTTDRSFYSTKRWLLNIYQETRLNTSPQRCNSKYNLGYPVPSTILKRWYLKIKHLSNKLVPEGSVVEKQQENVCIVTK